jgi:hypothetical protein
MMMLPSMMSDMPGKGEKCALEVSLPFSEAFTGWLVCRDMMIPFFGTLYEVILTKN